MINIHFFIFSSDAFPFCLLALNSFSNVLVSFSATINVRKEMSPTCNHVSCVITLFFLLLQNLPICNPKTLQLA